MGFRVAPGRTKRDESFAAARGKGGNESRQSGQGRKMDQHLGRDAGVAIATGADVAFDPSRELGPYCSDRRDPSCTAPMFRVTAMMSRFCRPSAGSRNTPIWLAAPVIRIVAFSCSRMPGTNSKFRFKNVGKPCRPCTFVRQRPESLQVRNRPRNHPALLVPDENRNADFISLPAGIPTSHEVDPGSHRFDRPECRVANSA